MGQPTPIITPYAYMRYVRDECPEVSATARMVAWAIAMRCDEDCHCWPSYRQLADDTGFIRPTVIKHVRTLANAGLLVVIRRTNHRGDQSNSYVLTYPQPVDKPVDNEADEYHRNTPPVSQEYSLGSVTGIPRSTYPKKNPRADAARSVDKSPVRDLIADLSKAHRLP